MKTKKTFRITMEDTYQMHTHYNIVAEDEEMARDIAMQRHGESPDPELKDILESFVEWNHINTEEIVPDGSAIRKVAQVIEEKGKLEAEILLEYCNYCPVQLNLDNACSLTSCEECCHENEHCEYHN